MVEATSPCCVVRGCGVAPGVDSGERSIVMLGWLGVVGCMPCAAGGSAEFCRQVGCTSLGVSAGESAGLWTPERPAAKVEDTLVPNMDGVSWWDCNSLRAEISLESSRLGHVLQESWHSVESLTSNTEQSFAVSVAPMVLDLLLPCTKYRVSVHATNHNAVSRDSYGALNAC